MAKSGDSLKTKKIGDEDIEISYRDFILFKRLEDIANAIRSK